MNEQATTRLDKRISQPAPSLWLRVSKSLRPAPRRVGLKVKPTPLWLSRLRTLREMFDGLLWVVRMPATLKEKARIMRALQVIGRHIGGASAKAVGYRIGSIVVCQSNGDRVAADRLAADLLTRVADMLRPPTSMSFAQIMDQLDRHERMARELKGGTT